MSSGGSTMAVIRIPHDGEPLMPPVCTWDPADDGYHRCLICNRYATDGYIGSNMHRDRWVRYHRSPWALPPAAVKPETTMEPPPGLPQQQPPPAGTEAQQTLNIDDLRSTLMIMVEQMASLQERLREDNLALNRLRAALIQATSQLAALPAATQVATQAD